MSERFCIDQIVLFTGLYKKFMDPVYEKGFYYYLEQLRTSKGFKTQDDALDYAIEFTK